MLEALLLKVVITVATAGATYLTHRVGEFFKAKTNNEKIRSAIDIVDKIVIDSVKVTEQTIKKDLLKASADGKITREEAKTLLLSTVDSAVREIPRDIEKQIVKMTPDINEYINKKVEAVIHDMKSGKIKNIETRIGSFWG